MNELQYSIDALKKAEAHLKETFRNLSEFSDYRGETEELEIATLLYPGMRYCVEIILKAIEMKTEALNPTPEPAPHSPVQ